jgi:hypothetical protein
MSENNKNPQPLDNNILIMYRQQAMNQQGSYQPVPISETQNGNNMPHHPPGGKVIWFTKMNIFFCVMTVVILAALVILLCLFK